jgi:hypothetical protein
MVVFLIVEIDFGIDLKKSFKKKSCELFKKGFQIYLIPL